MKWLKNKRHTMKYTFLKDKLLVYLGTFTFPVLLLGLLFLGGVYLREQNKVQDKLQISLDLAVDHMDSFYTDLDAFQNYLGSAQRMGQFYNIFRSNAIDYDSANALRYLSAYMVSLESARTDVESIYFYLDNPCKRVVTSEKYIENADLMKDQGWIETLIGMKGNETLATVRESGSTYSSSGKVFSMFRRYPNWKGGMVLNYQLEEQKKKMQQMTYYEGQYLLLFDQQGELLFSNYELEPEEKEELISVMKDDPEAKRIRLKGGYYLTDMAMNTAGSLYVVTLAPHSVVNQVFLSNMKTLIFLVLITTVASAYLAYDRAVRNYQQLYSIVDIFDRAEKNLELPELTEKKESLYSHILNNIIHTFLENSYLQIQLSERRYRQISAQMLALQYQINPHFLFNTLQAINYEILTVTQGKAGNANRMVENLSDLLRYALDTSKEDVSIREEVDICKKYIDIQKMREDRDFVVEWEIAPQIESCRIQRMLLQPLLENAISHGLRFKERGRLRVAIRNEKNQICFKVIDNGVGISKEKQVRLRERLERTKDEFESEHIGLTNVNQRLILAYGEDSGIRIFSKEGIGTIQYFRIDKG